MDDCGIFYWSIVFACSQPLQGSIAPSDCGCAEDQIDMDRSGRFASAVIYLECLLLSLELTIVDHCSKIIQPVHESQLIILKMVLLFQSEDDRFAGYLAP